MASTPPRIALLLVLVLSLFATPASAQLDPPGPGEVWISDDLPIHEPCLQSVPFVVFPLHVYGEPTTDIAGFEFSIDLPPGFLVVGTLPPPGVLNVAPNPDDGNWLGVLECAEPGLRWLGGFEILVTGTVADALVCVGPYVASGQDAPRWTDCTNEPHDFAPWPPVDFPFLPEGCIVFNATSECPVGVAESGASWGGIKARWR